MYPCYALHKEYSDWIWRFTLEILYITLIFSYLFVDDRIFAIFFSHCFKMLQMFIVFTFLSKISSSLLTFYGWDLTVSRLQNHYVETVCIVRPPTPRPGWWWGGGKGGGASHFLERSYRRNLGQIGILSGNWHFRWGWFFLGGT